MSIFRGGFPEQLMPVLEQGLDYYGLDGIFAQAMESMLKKEAVAVNLLEERFKTLGVDDRLKALGVGPKYRVYPNHDWPTEGEPQTCANIRQRVREEMERLGIVTAEDDEFTVAIIAEALGNKYQELSRPGATTVQDVLGLFG